MRSIFASNLVMAGVLGVFLLLASAVGRVAATNLGGWLMGHGLRVERSLAGAPARMEVAIRTPSAWR